MWVSPAASVLAIRHFILNFKHRVPAEEWTSDVGVAKILDELLKAWRSWRSYLDVDDPMNFSNFMNNNSLAVYNEEGCNSSSSKLPVGNCHSVVNCLSLMLHERLDRRPLERLSSGNVLQCDLHRTQ